MAERPRKKLLSLEKAEERLATAQPTSNLPQAAPIAAPELRSLAEVAVSSELATLFYEARNLLTTIKDDSEVPANQKAQVLNSVLGILERITKARTDLYNAERIRFLEQTLLRVMREQPQEVKEAFMSAYEEDLAG